MDDGGGDYGKYGAVTKMVERKYRDLHAKEAVTKTDANPPIPPTKGASPTYQAFAPR